MPLSYTQSIAPFPVWATDQAALPAGLNRYQSMVTPEIMKGSALFGLPLKSTLTQQTLSDETIQKFISSAVSEVEMATDLYIYPVTFKEKHDYSRDIFNWSYCYIKLNHPNVLSVSKVEISYVNDMKSEGFVSFPLEHVQLMPQEGVMQLVPAVGSTFGGFLLTAFAGAQYQAMRYLGATDYPGAIRVEYKCGFEEGKIPAAIVQLIEFTAAYNILSTLGPILFPFSSVSISIDGVSQGNSLPGPGFLQGRLNELKEKKQELLATVKGYFQRSLLIDFF
jgi:hypothetical protein